MTSTATRRAPRPGPAGPAMGWRGIAISLSALALAALLAGHRTVPGGLGTVLDTMLPWLGLGVPVLVLAAVWRRAWGSLAAVMVPALIWAAMFGHLFVRFGGGGDYDLRAVSQNMYAHNANPALTAERLRALRPDLLALQELPSGSYPEALDAGYPHQVVRGTVGIWSRWPIESVRPVRLGLGWTRALRTVVAAPQGPLTVYVAHLGSARPGATRGRDATLARLAAAIKADRSERVLVLGDLNTATTDRALRGLVPPLDEAQEGAGSGFGFTWPSELPVARPDHILYRGMKAVDAAAVRTPGTDHRAVRADFRY